MVWDWDRASNNTGNIPNKSSVILYYIFLPSHILSFGDYKIKILISSGKHYFLCPAAYLHSGKTKFFSPDWSGTYYIDEDDFELLMFLPSARIIAMHHHAREDLNPYVKLNTSIRVQNKRGNNSIPKNYFKIDLRFILNKCLVCLFDIF